jgi:glutathione-regulated potassium-efflux system protein KefB
MDAFGIVLFLAVIVAAMAVEHVGISMTLGAFLLGMLLSASDFRYQIEATVAPFKSTLMGLFFIAVGMSIDIGALMREWMDIIVHVPIVLVLKSSILIGLVLAFGISRPAAIRTGFYLSQVGEFAFVLLGAASVAGLLTVNGHTLAMLVVAVSMVATPFMVKTGDYLAKRLHITTGEAGLGSVNDLTRHVVIIGYEEVGQLIGLMLEKANIPYIAFDSDISIVLQAKRLNRPVHFGDMFNPTTQEAAKLSKAAAVYVTSRNINRAKGLAITLHRLYPNLNVFVRVRTINDQDELVTKGIKNAGTGYIESTLVRGSMLLQSLGVSEDKVREMVNELHQNDYAVIRSDFAKIEKNID